MATDADRDLYDQAADRYPTTLRVDPDALELAGALFGEDPDPLPGRWLDNVYYLPPEDR